MADRSQDPRDSHRSRNSRSRSPRRQDESHSRSHRKRSPHSHRHRKPKRAPDTDVGSLPYDASRLESKDYDAYRNLFGVYLDLQKGKVLMDLEDREARGRWKSFVRHWNRGELDKRWYDPLTFEKASGPSASRNDAGAADSGRAAASGWEAEDDSEEEEIGPALPGQERTRDGKMGPSIPDMQDLELKREMELDDIHSRRQDLHFQRKADLKSQKSALDELVPRAEAGTRERQLEKKKELNEKMRSFREKSPGAAEVPDTELMGGGDGIESLKKLKEVGERKKNERELRREEIMRARMAEREERLSEYRSKEEGTMQMLKALAKQRFG